MNLNLNDINVEISQNTIDAYLAHEAFCSAGEDWLLLNDSGGRLEENLIDKVKESFYDDFIKSISNFEISLQETCEEIFINLHVDDYWDELGELIDCSR